MKKTVAICQAAAIAAGLLLVGSTASFAAKRTTQKPDRIEKLQPRAITPNGSTFRLQRRDPYPYGRDPDPYAPGVNWPKGA
jgi:hypothetical protein